MVALGPDPEPSPWLLSAACVIIVLSSGCLNGADGPQTPSETWKRIDGTAVDRVYILSSPDPAADVDLSPDETSVALLSRNGTVSVVDMNGTLLQWWPIPVAPTACWYHDECVIRSLPGDRFLVVVAHNVWMYGPWGFPLWDREIPQDASPISSADVAPLSDELVLGFDNGTVEVWPMNGSLASRVLAREATRIWDVAASGNGAVIGVTSDAARFYTRSGDLLAEVPRVADVAVSDDGRLAVVGNAGSWVAMNVTVLPLVPMAFAQRNLTAPEDSEGHTAYGSRPAQVEVSPQGKFVLQESIIRYPECVGDVCGLPDTWVGRMFDTAYITRDVGFGMGPILRLFPHDDGSAIGFGLIPSPSWWEVTMVIAPAGAVPPRWERG